MHTSELLLTPKFHEMVLTKFDQCCSLSEDKGRFAMMSKRFAAIMVLLTLSGSDAYLCSIGQAGEEGEPGIDKETCCTKFACDMCPLVPSID